MDAPKSSAPARTPKDPATRLAELEERLANEMLSVDERCELADLVARLHRKLS